MAYQDSMGKHITVAECRKKFGDKATEIVLYDVARFGRYFRVGNKTYWLED